MSEAVAPRYIKKPHAVEAVQLTRTNVEFLANWCGGVVIRERQAYISLDIPNLFGSLRVQVGDYLTKDEQGRFDRVSESEFESAYQPEGVIERLSRLEKTWSERAQSHG
jgi:hypothetical protein